MDHPSIMKLLEGDEDEDMHSGADVEAMSAALNRDIGGDSSTFSQPSDSESVEVLPQASSSASQQLLGQWQTSSQEGNTNEDIQPKEDQLHSQSSEQPSSPIKVARHVSRTNDQDQQSNTQPKDDKEWLQKEHCHSDQRLQSETNVPQTVENDQVNPSDQIPFQIPKQESSSQHSENQQQNTNHQMNVEQATTFNEANLAANRTRASTSIPFQLLLPIIRPHLDKDRSMQLQSVFTKLRTNEVSKDDFLRVIRNIVGDQMLRQAVNKVHMQLQAQAGRNQQSNPNQYALQNQISQQQLLSRGANQFPNPRAFSSINSMSSSQNQKGHCPRQPIPALAVQMQMDDSFPSTENSGQKAREIETNTDGRGMHSVQMHSTNKNILNPEREVFMNASQGSNKQQQHLPRPQTSFPIYNGSSSNFHSHPYARPPINAAITSLSQQPQDSQMRQVPRTQGTTSTQLGPIQPGNVINVPKYELQNIANEPKRFHGGPLTSHLASQHHQVPWQTTTNREQRSASIPSTPHVKQEVVDQFSEPPNKSQLTASDGSSFASGQIGQGNSTFGSLNNEGLENQASRMGVPSTIGSQTNLSDSTMQNSSTFVAGTATKTPPKKTSIGQKKPFEAIVNSPAMASKKQKTTGVFHDQSIEHLNDVTAVSGVNLREEEEQLFSAPKEDSRASEATRRVVQEEEERLILQKAPLQKKLADIIFKSGLKKISSEAERCLSMCVEERLRGIVSSLIRLSKQRVDVEKMRHRFVITSDVRRHILETNNKAKEEWDKKQSDEAEKLRKVNEADANAGSDAERDKDEGRSKFNKANKEEDDKMRATAANVAARAAVGGDDMLSKWQLMAEQARQKREGLDGPSKTTASRPPTSLKRNFKAHQETPRRGASFSGNRKFGRGPMAMSQSKVTRNISRKDVIAVLEREPQMSKSTLIYRLYEKSSSDSIVE